MSTVHEVLNRPVFLRSPDPDTLEEALKTADSLGARTPEAKALQVAARALLVMRTAAREGRWGEVAKEGQSQGTQAAMEDELVPLFAGREAAALVAVAERRHAESSVLDALT